MARRNYDLILGADFLREHDAVVSHPERKIFFLAGDPEQVQKNLGKAYTDHHKFETLEGHKAEGRIRRKTDSHVLIELKEDRKQISIEIESLTPPCQEHLFGSALRFIELYQTLGNKEVFGA